MLGWTTLYFSAVQFPRSPKTFPQEFCPKKSCTCPKKLCLPMDRSDLHASGHARSGTGTCDRGDNRCSGKTFEHTSHSKKARPLLISYQDHRMLSLSSEDRPLIFVPGAPHIMLSRVETGPYFVPGSPHVVARSRWPRPPPRGLTPR